MTQIQLNNYKSRLLIRLILFAFIISLVGLTSDGAFAAKTATLENVKGNIKVFKAGSSRGKRGRPGMALFAGSTVKSLDSSGMADIHFQNGSITRIMPNSEVKITSAKVTKSDLEVQMDLAAGKVFSVVNKLSRNSRFEVRTRTGTSGVKGTIFSTETNGNETVIMVKEGKVEATNPGASSQAVMVADLKKSVIKANQAPSAPIPLTKEEIALFDVLNDIMAEVREEIQEDVKDTIREEIILDGIFDR